jgi:3-hydroxyacyl-CoA dehydrogenase
MVQRIDKVAVIGAGTMGSGIAALCAEAGCTVRLLDVSADLAARAVARMAEGRAPMLDDPAAAGRITTGAIESDLGLIADADWVCEAVIEDLETKRRLFERVEGARREGSILSTNTSGIPLRAITEGMPARLRRDIAVTHFFNPVKVMKLLELVPGAATRPEVIATLAAFCSERLGKGVVHGKDTVNFIANRIGCFWMLAGLHHGEAARREGLAVEEVDALLSGPFGIPATGLYGLLDLVGLDVMDLVAKNLAANLPPNDAGRAIASLPPAEQAMLARGQVGRKAGAGFYRLQKGADGSRIKEVFEPAEERWRPARPVELAAEHREAASLLFADDPAGRLAWAVMGATLAYAADLVPEIADDLVNVDRAMRWGFNWADGPFELLDRLGPEWVAARIEAAGEPVPHMLRVLRRAGAERFYQGGREHLGPDGAFHPIPA